MRVIVAGTRDCTNPELVGSAIASSGFDVRELVEGGASGVDRLARQWAIERGLPYTTFNADWGRHGRSAGPKRNQQMADYAEALVAVWDGESPGTADMISRATARGLPVYIERYSA